MTRDRQAAIDRAVAAYRRLIVVRAPNTAAEMIADLLEWHKLYVDKEVDVAALLETATRRAAVAEAARESESRMVAEQREIQERAEVEFAEVPMPADPAGMTDTLSRILRNSNTWESYRDQQAPVIEVTEVQDDVEF